MRTPGLLLDSRSRSVILLCSPVRELLTTMRLKSEAGRFQSAGSEPVSKFEDLQGGCQHPCSLAQHKQHRGAASPRLGSRLHPHTNSCWHASGSTTQLSTAGHGRSAAQRSAAWLTGPGQSGFWAMSNWPGSTPRTGCCPDKQASTWTEHSCLQVRPSAWRSKAVGLEPAPAPTAPSPLSHTPPTHQQ